MFRYNIDCHASHSWIPALQFISLKFVFENLTTTQLRYVDSNCTSKIWYQRKKNIMRYDIFLSYSHLDSNIALELREKFLASGLTCFMAEKSLEVGDQWINQVREAIRESETILILITPRSVSSKWVYMEVGAAWMENKKIIPLTQFVDISGLPELIKNLQAKSIETEKEKLGLVYELIGRKGATAPVIITFEFIVDKIRLAKSLMDKDRFQPNLFIGLGRGGAICAGIFASHFGFHSLKAVDCQFKGLGDRRITILDDSSLTKKTVSGKNVLVIEWARQSGRTYKLIKEKILVLKPASLKSYAMFWTGSKNPPDYIALHTDTVPSNPWSIY
ncbi:MAG: TIR domain-containing protein [Chloroflexi bacterium]|nr:MAG: TIR domain-containing protein [Chloroflexota bacterium]